MEELPSPAGERGLSRFLLTCAESTLLPAVGGREATPLVDAFWLGGLETVIEARLPVSSRSSSGQHVLTTLAWASSGKAVLAESWGSGVQVPTAPPAVTLESRFLAA